MAETGTIGQRATAPIFDGQELADAAAAALAAARVELREIESVPLDAVTPEKVLDAWDRVAIGLEDAFGPISLLNSVHSDAAVRDAADRALIEESVFMTELFQNEQLYERVRRVVPSTSSQKQLQKDLLEAFEDSGAAPPAGKRRARGPLSRLSHEGH